ncbi:MAG: phosphate ABC transporter permease subunit PstC [Chlorobia bacterium]|nr:phosphate ABC transporter permease subunit PstC [Fimbriimonadaceae bacterium]
MTSLVYASGGVIVGIILAIAYYLTHESTYAFDRKFDFGYRFALQPIKGEFEDLDIDPNATLLTANREGMDELDEKEEGVPFPTIESLAGVAKFGTGSPQASTLSNAIPEETFKDHWKGMKRADRSTKFLLFGFATPEYKDPKMALAWSPDAAFDPNLTPFDLKLKLVQSPAGVKTDPIEIDLRKQKTGRIELPTFVARTDEDRQKGYVFELVATPTMSHNVAVLAGTMRSEWDGTLAYPRFGIVPLIVGTLILTIIAVLIATPFSIGAAVYLSEIAPNRVREWLKPLVELLASVPTVVLGYFGLMLLAPFLGNTLAAAVGLESGRALLTAAIMMAVLLFPTITSFAEDALQAVPQSMRDGGEALGLTAREKLKKIILPAAKGGIISAVILGIARAIGETMIVWILSGGTPFLPSFASPKDAVANLMKPMKGVPDAIAIEMGNVDFEGVHYGHLFLLGLVLFIITLAINTIGQRMAKKVAWRS